MTLMKFACVLVLAASAVLLASQPAAARRLHVQHLGGHPGVVHMHVAGHARPHG